MYCRAHHSILALGNMHRHLLRLALILGLISCTQTTHNLATPEFQEVVTELNKIRSEKYVHSLLPKLDSAFQQCKTKRPLDWYEYYDMHAWHAWSMKNLESALSYTDSMITVLTPFNGVEGEYLHALVQKGILYQDLNLYTEALKSFFTASAYAEKYMDQCGSGEVHYSLAKILYIQGNYPDALQYYQKALSSCRQCDTSSFDQFYYIGQGALNSIGLCYERLNEYKLARENYRDALRFINRYAKNFPNESNFSRSAKAIIEGNLGNTERILGNYAEAKRLFESSIDFNNQLGEDINDAIFTRIKLAQLYAEMGQMENTISLSDSIQIQLERWPSMEAEIRLADLLSEVYLSIGDPAKSLEALHKKRRYEDSQSMARKELPTLNVPASLSYLQQKQELQELKRKQDRMTQILISVLFILGLSILILSLIRRNQKAAKRHSNSLAKINEELQVRNKQLMQTMADLEASQEENARILKIVAHDLRSPVTGINTLASLLLDSETLHKTNRTEVEMIRKVSDDSLKFMEELLNVNSSFRPEEKVSTDLLDLLEYCVNYMQHKAAEKKQRLEVKGNHVFLPIYRERVWRVINNLISNAIKFSPECGLIQLELFETPAYVRIHVKDQGIGIPEEMKKQIFEMAGQSGRKGTSGERSFGLGLAISLQIMEAHDGRLWFESEINQGATFIMEFPRQGAKGKMQPAETESGFNLN